MIYDKLTKVAIFRYTGSKARKGILIKNNLMHDVHNFSYNFNFWTDIEKD